MERKPVDKVSSLLKSLEGNAACLSHATVAVYRFTLPRSERSDETVNHAFQCSVRHSRNQALDETEHRSPIDQSGFIRL